MTMTIRPLSTIKFIGLSETNTIGYERRAQHAGQYGVEVEGGRVPTPDWMLNLHILTSGGLRCAAASSTT
jgi:hypothetical protein